MKIKDIVELENRNTSSVNLINEGLFWPAYEKSASIFTTYIKEYQLIKKYVKNVKTDIVYMGFPGNMLEKIINSCTDKIIKRDTGFIQLKPYDINQESFILWKAKIKMYESNINQIIKEIHH